MEVTHCPPDQTVVRVEVSEASTAQDLHQLRVRVGHPGAEPEADALREKIRDAIRTGASPRHVPDEILEVPGVPHTRTGKKLEVPVKRLLQGAPVEQVVNPAVVDAPDLLEHYARLGAEHRGSLPDPAH